jgi:lantibiotic biosynthesis protein
VKLPETGLAAAAAVAERLADPTDYTPPGIDPVRYLPQSLAGGAVGIALLHAERARTGHGDPRTAHTWLSAACTDEVSTADDASLFFGAPAVAFATAAVADRPDRYRRALSTLDAATTKLTARRLTAAADRLEHGAVVAMAEFDTVRGLAGLGTYYLLRHPDSAITTDVLRYLVRLTQPLPRSGGRPGWWTDVSPNGAPHLDYPGGHGNLGMSHGIAAVLALLSRALIDGVTVDGHAEAIERICAWIDSWRHDEESGPWWPGYITAAQASGLEPPRRPRPSWCYGVPGTARAVQLAGLALRDPQRQVVAELAMCAALRETELDRLGGDIGLCHGLAGVLQSAWRMSADARGSLLAAELPRVTTRLITALEQDMLNLELMDGAAGAALALHTIDTDTAPASGWDAFLLLS